MDLTAALLRVAARRPHVLVVAVPGSAGARLALEAALVRRGWPLATGPADADVLAVAGAPGPELAAVVERIWRQVPAPRARIGIRTAGAADDALDAAAALLRDAAHQRRPPATSTAGDDGRDHGGDGDRSDRGGNGHAGGHAGGHDGRHGGRHGGDGGAHGGDHGDGHGDGHGGHHGHHGHGDMELPGGLPMADLGEDRDGLVLDRLHVPLGPVLPDWPAGLVVRVALQGDVVQEAAAEVLDAGRAAPSVWPDPVARELDALARFLAVAGWAAAAARARALRDGETGRAEALVRRVRRSRTLRWSVRGLPAGSTDVAALLEERLVGVEAATRGSPSARRGVEELPGLLVGAELAAARLIVAAVDPDTERAGVPREVRHG